jgi:serine/threonine protein kinase
MGIVYQAQHLRLGHEVALKLLKAQGGPSQPKKHRRLLREARSIAQINHPSVVKILDVDTLSDGSPYLVLELLRGNTLAQELRKRGPLPIEECLTIGIQTCRALQSAHNLGIIHRDIKPSNLFLIKEEFSDVNSTSSRLSNGEIFNESAVERSDIARRIKILDFGLSKAISDSSEDLTLTNGNTAFGSPRYMSPEQIRCAKTVDHRADLWSLGITLYELLTATFPFEGEHLAAMAAAIAADTPIPMTVYREDIPSPLSEAVLRCLRKNREERWQQARDLGDALERCLVDLRHNDRQIGLSSDLLDSKNPTQKTKITISRWWFSIGLVVSVFLVGSWLSQPSNNSFDQNLSPERPFHPTAATSSPELPFYPAKEAIRIPIRASASAKRSPASLQFQIATAPKKKKTPIPSAPKQLAVIVPYKESNSIKKSTLHLPLGQGERKAIENRK